MLVSKLAIDLGSLICEVALPTSQPRLLPYNKQHTMEEMWSEVLYAHGAVYKMHSYDYCDIQWQSSNIGHLEIQ